MTLGDDVIDEYSRHVLVPEIGPAGQARLLATRVRVSGDHASAPFVRELLARSGLRPTDAAGDAAVFLGVTPDAGAPCPTVAGWGRDDVVHATVLGGRPCPACAAVPAASMPETPLATQSLAALVATVLVLHVVDPARASRHVRLDLASGRLASEPLGGRGCARCAAARDLT